MPKEVTFEEALDRAERMSEPGLRAWNYADEEW